MNLFFCINIIYILKNNYNYIIFHEERKKESIKYKLEELLYDYFVDILRYDISLQWINNYLSTSPMA